jgi:hypothetical protein
MDSVDDSVESDNQVIKKIFVDKVIHRVSRKYCITDEKCKFLLKKKAHEWIEQFFFNYNKEIDTVSTPQNILRELYVYLEECFYSIGLEPMIIEKME